MAEIANRDKHEASFARRLGKLSGRHRRELQSLLGHPPDISRVPPSFWERVRQETEEELAALLLLIFIASATQHGAERELSETRGLVWARDHAAQVASGHVQSAQEMMQTSARDWRQAEPTKGQVLDRVTQIFGPRRVTSLAVSGTTAARTAGGEVGVEETTGLSEDDTWFTQGDDSVCPICAPLHKTARSVWSLKFPSGPPAHVRGGAGFIDADCRCWIQYAAEKRAK